MEQQPTHIVEQESGGIKDYARIFFRRQLVFWGCFLFTLGVGTTSLFSIRPIYRTVAAIQVARGIRLPLQEASDDLAMVNAVATTLKGEMLRLRTKMALLTKEDGMDFRYKRTKVNVERPSWTVIPITVDGPYKEFTKTYAETFLEQYFKIREEQKTESADSAIGRLTKEIERVNTLVLDAQQRLKEFKGKNEGLLLEEYGNYSMRYYQDLAAKISQLENRKLSMEQQMEALQRSDNPIAWISVIDAALRPIPVSQPSIQTIPRDEHKTQQGGTAAKEEDNVLTRTRGNPVEFAEESVTFALEQSQRKSWNNLKAKYEGLRSAMARVETVYRPEHPTRIALAQALVTTTNEIRSEVGEMMRTFRVQYQMLCREIDSLSVSATGGAGTQNLINLANLNRMNDLKQEVHNLQLLYDSLIKRANELNVSADTALVTVSLMEKPEILERPIWPKPMKFMIQFFLIGLALGFVAIGVIEALDDSIKSSEDLKKYVGLTCLGVVPTIHWKKKSLVTHRLPSIDDQDAVESYRTIRTDILLSRPHGALKTLLITSAIPSEGKTTVAVNIATVMAQADQKVLLIDSDLRRPNIHNFFKLANQKGFSSVLTHEATIEDCILKTDIANLDFLPAGPRSPDPVKFFLSPSIKDVFTYLCGHYDIVIIDTAPVFSYTDAVILSDFVDGIAFVVHGGKTSRALIERARELLSGNAHKVIGGIINRLPVRDAYYYYPAHEHRDRKEPKEHKEHKENKEHQENKAPDPKKEP